jgi:hypothetical protein
MLALQLPSSAVQEHDSRRGVEVAVEAPSNKQISRLAAKALIDLFSWT